MEKLQSSCATIRKYLGDLTKQNLLKLASTNPAKAVERIFVLWISFLVPNS